jgi:hypothetical protein
LPERGKQYVLYLCRRRDIAHRVVARRGRFAPLIGIVAKAPKTGGAAPAPGRVRWFSAFLAARAARSGW